MDDRKIEVFLSAVQTGSFSKAASECHCTQSAVTQAVNAFEAELGCTLLKRGHGGVLLTEHGQKLLPYIIDTQASLERLNERAWSISHESDVSIRIGCFASIANTWLPDAIIDYSKENPHVSFEIEVSEDVLSNKLLDGRLDLVIADALRVKGARLRPLMEDPYFAVLPKDWAPHLSVVRKEDFDSLPFVMAPRDALEVYLDYVPPRSMSVSCDDDSTLLAMVARGAGVTAVPRLALENKPEGLRVLPLEPPVSRVLGVALPSVPTEGAQLFSDFLVDRFAYGK